MEGRAKIHQRKGFVWIVLAGADEQQGFEVSWTRPHRLVLNVYGHLAKHIFPLWLFPLWGVLTNFERHLLVRVFRHECLEVHVPMTLSLALISSRTWPPALLRRSTLTWEVKRLYESRRLVVLPCGWWLGFLFVNWLWVDQYIGPWTFLWVFFVVFANLRRRIKRWVVAGRWRSSPERPWLQHLNAPPGAISRAFWDLKAIKTLQKEALIQTSSGVGFVMMN